MCGMAGVVSKTLRPVRIVTIVGARPQFVKAAVIDRAFARHAPGAADVSILHTGQHYDRLLSGAFFDELAIPEPAVNLEVGSGGQGETTGRMLAGIERELVARTPDWVVVVGDTNSTLAGALAASKLHVPVAHVEAGLRSHNRRMPEEVNRVVVDHVSSLLLCPSDSAARNLGREGIVTGVHVIGDVMVDALLQYRAQARRPRRTAPFALATVHRRENVESPERLRAIVAALAEAPLRVVMPLHPGTARALDARRIRGGGALQFVAPLTYLETLGHLEECRFVLTDSGGLQKEACFFGKRCITLRDETEWTELVDMGVNRVTGADPAAIRDAMRWAAAPPGPVEPLYGRGDAGRKLVELLLAAGRARLSPSPECPTA